MMKGLYPLPILFTRCALGRQLHLMVHNQTNVHIVLKHFFDMVKYPKTLGGKHVKGSTKKVYLDSIMRFLKCYEILYGVAML